MKSMFGAFAAILVWAPHLSFACSDSSHPTAQAAPMEASAALAPTTERTVSQQKITKLWKQVLSVPQPDTIQIDATHRHLKVQSANAKPVSIK